MGYCRTLLDILDPAHGTEFIFVSGSSAISWEISINFQLVKAPIKGEWSLSSSIWSFKSFPVSGTKIAKLGWNNDYNPPIGVKKMLTREIFSGVTSFIFHWKIILIILIKEFQIPVFINFPHKIFISVPILDCQMSI